MICRNLFLSIALGVSFAASIQADVVTDWNKHLLDAFRTNRTTPPVASRQLAILHVAIYDAVNGINGRYQPYRVRARLPGFLSEEAAAAAAAHRVMTTFYPGNSAAYDAALQAALSQIQNRLASRIGAAWGRHVANNILMARANDGSSDVVAYQPGTQPGQWVPTPPAFAPALLPGWGLVKPFGIPRGDIFRAPPPPALDTPKYAEELNEVKIIGANNSAIRTADQTIIAQFWANGAGTETPPGHWNRIAASISQARGLSLRDNARLFALLNIAEADAAILCWDCKFAYSYWRPVTAIRNAHLDGNDATEADPGWTPLLITPPFPEYTSGHSTFSGAAARVLEIFFGTDEITFTIDSDGTPGHFRTFTSINDAADESAISRLYGGIHFTSGNEWGLATGRAAGEVIATHLLQRVKGKGQRDRDDDSRDRDDD